MVSSSDRTAYYWSSVNRVGGAKEGRREEGRTVDIILSKWAIIRTGIDRFLPATRQLRGERFKNAPKDLGYIPRVSL